MNIRCPYCGHGMGLKDIKPGKYKPKCSKCEKRFLLTLSSDAAQSPDVQPLEDVNLTQAGVDATVAPTHKTTGLDATIAHASASPSNTGTEKNANKTMPEGHNAPLASKTMPEVPASPKSPSASTPASSTKSPSKSGKLTVREITKAGHVEATIAPQQANPDDLTAAPPEEEMRASSPGTQAEMDATVIIPQKKAAGVPEMLGGYKLMKELGRGAMGAVYMAKQLSLDRNVALKLIQAKWASNPVFIARFTREAYAAAQLTHHNVVQIYDLGCQGDINYYTMEYVTGNSLAQIVQKSGKLDAEAAVGYVLQAARGLNFAHMQGMVHRDVKPANLMLNDQGVVKVADLGLVKTPHLVEEPGEQHMPSSGISGHGSSLSAATAEVTMANIAMGTPAYMAPEQASNAAGVDHRADIYSLGCTLYVLLTGRPPFEGASALEVITKHRTEAITRPEAIVKRIPGELSNIVIKMVAKRPEDRYQNMSEVIRVLENFLGVQSSGPFSPKDEHSQTLEKSLEQYNYGVMVKVRDFGMMGFLAGSIGLAVIFLLMFRLPMSFATLAMAVAAAVTYFVVSGLADRTYLFDKVRSYFFSQRISDWITNIGGVCIGSLLVWLVELHFYVIGGAIVGGLIGTAFYFAIDKQLAASRKNSLSAMEALLKSLRIKGVEEAAIEQFVVKYSGDDWEEFYEALFGYESKIRARTELGRSEQGRRRRKYATWRDGIIRSIEAKLTADQESRDRKHLQKVEEANLKAQGVNATDARQEAELMAAAQVDAGAEIRATPTMATLTSPEQLSQVDPRLIAAKKRDRQLQMLAEARGAKKKGWQDTELFRQLAGPASFFFGAKVRFLAGALLLATFAFWLDTNNVFRLLNDEAIKIVDAPADTSPATTPSTSEKPEDVLQNLEKPAETKPASPKATEPTKIPPTIINLLTKVVMEPTSLEPVPFIPSGFCHVGLGVAGSILLILGVFQGWKMSVFAWPAAFVAILSGSLIGFAIAAGLAVVGLLVGRTID